MNLIYPKGKEGFANAAINWGSDTIKAVAVGSGYTYSATHQYLSDITDTIGTAVTLTSKTNSNGALGGTIPTFSSMSGGPLYAIIIYKDTGTAGTSPLIGYFDGKVQVEIAATASTSATSITPEDLPADIASGATLTKIEWDRPIVGDHIGIRFRRRSRSQRDCPEQRHHRRRSVRVPGQRCEPAPHPQRWRRHNLDGQRYLRPLTGQTHAGTLPTGPKRPKGIPVRLV